MFEPGTHWALPVRQFGNGVCDGPLGAGLLGAAQQASLWLFQILSFRDTPPAGILPPHQEHVRVFWQVLRHSIE
jgi:hypothetical protein